jgi:hypothetical protein
MLTLGLGLSAFSLWQRLLVDALLGMAEAFDANGEAEYRLFSLVAPYLGALLLLWGLALLAWPRARR